MNDERLDEMLHTLAPPATSAGFTRRVVAAAREAKRRRRNARRQLAAAAGVALVLIAGVTGHQLTRHAKTEAEQRDIRRELESLKAMTQSEETLIPIATSGGTEYVIDIRDLAVAARELQEERENHTMLVSERIH